MAETVFWQERAAILSALSEQLKRPVVKKILEVMNKADVSIVQTLEETLAELSKYLVEADEIKSFLLLMGRHFTVN